MLLDFRVPDTIWNGFPYVMQETAKLYKAYYRPNEVSLYETNKPQPLWTKEDLVIIMSKLVASEGFLLYHDLCEKLGTMVVDSFIEHNVLHLRPTTLYMYDLPAAFYSKQIDVPIVTAESACGLYAMRLVLNQ